MSNLAALKESIGLSGVTLAFVLSTGGCTWAGARIGVDGFRAAGGKVKASFGGAQGRYLENACADAPSLAKAIGQFVDDTGIDDLDFDVEQAVAMTPQINEKRAKALKRVQDERGIKVSLTLAARPHDQGETRAGITGPALTVVQSVLQAGVKVSHVNLMAMDYGDAYGVGNAMGAAAISSLTAAKAQLQGMIAGLTETEAWGMLGVTPMIGQNDVPSEVFTLADAQMLVSFAKEKHLGLLSFWS